MKSGWTKAFSRVIAGAVCGVGVMALTCGGPTSPVAKTTPVDSLVITNQITGWVLDSSESVSGAAMMPFTNTTANNNWVDGGCPSYCGNCDGTDALKDGFGTYLKEPLAGATRKLELFVLDYGSARAADSEFNVWVTKNSGSVSETITPFSTTTAIGFDEGGGLNVYAHMSNIYIELRFTDYDSSSQVVPDASAFLTYYNSKIK
jgi:hypothetical protein